MESLTEQQLTTLARATADVLMAAWPTVARDTNLTAALRSPATSLSVRAGEALLDRDDRPVLSGVAQSLGEGGLLAAAQYWSEQLFNAAFAQLGPDHRDTLATRSNLAYWRGQAGDAAGAVAALEELLADQLMVLGPEHPDTLLTRSNLATWRGHKGAAAAAATALEELLLADQLQVLGPDHPDTVTTRNNLARRRVKRSLLTAPS